MNHKEQSVCARQAADQIGSVDYGFSVSPCSDDPQPCGTQAIRWADISSASGNVGRDVPPPYSECQKLLLKWGCGAEEEKELWDR